MMYVEMKRVSMKMVIYMNELAILITDVQMNQHPEHQEYPNDSLISSSEDEQLLEDQRSVDLSSDQLERRRIYRMRRLQEDKISAKDWKQWFEKLAEC